MAQKRSNQPSIEGHYNYYGVPAYILKQKKGTFVSGFYDPIEKVFKAGGSAKKILWDGIKITNADAKRLMRKYSRKYLQGGEDGSELPGWLLLPEEASFFMAQLDKLRAESAEQFKKLSSETPDEEQRPGEEPKKRSL